MNQTKSPKHEFWVKIFNPDRILWTGNQRSFILNNLKTKKFHYFISNKKRTKAKDALLSQVTFCSPDSFCFNNVSNFYKLFICLVFKYFAYIFFLAWFILIFKTFFVFGCCILSQIMLLMRFSFISCFQFHYFWLIYFEKGHCCC